MLKIYIVRHWETEENKLKIFQWHMPWNLTLEWIEQAQKIWKRLEDIKFDAIYCSPLKRTRDTLAEIIKFNTTENIFFHDLLKERDAWDATWKTVNEIDFTQAKWVETNLELRERAKDFLEFIKANHNSWTLLLVTHWWLIKRMFSYINDILEEDMNWIYASKNCWVSLIEIDWNKIKEIFFSDVSHLG